MTIIQLIKYFIVTQVVRPYLLSDMAIFFCLCFNMVFSCYILDYEFAMFSGLAKFFTRAGTKSNINGLKEYSTINVKNFDPNTVDPQAHINNPAVGKGQVHHPSIVRGTCSKIDCKVTNCGPLVPKISEDTLKANDSTGNCGESIQKLEAIAHATSGNPKVSQGHVITVDSNINMVGAKKQQNIVGYYTPNIAEDTTEFSAISGQPLGRGTQYLHDSENTHRIATIIEQTKNK